MFPCVACACFLRLTICYQLLFAEARRAELKDQKPELHVTEISKVSAKHLCPVSSARHKYGCVASLFLCN